MPCPPLLWRSIKVALLAACFASLPTAGQAELIPVAIELNAQEFQPTFVERDANGSLWMPLEYFNQLPLGVDDYPSRTFESDTYVEITAIKGLSVTLDETDLVLRLEALPEHLPSIQLDADLAQSKPRLSPDANSSFLNYAIDIAEGSEATNDQLRIHGELGTRFRDILFLSEHQYQDSEEEEGYVHLMTSLSGENRQSLLRWSAGDQFTSPAHFSGARLIGGLVFERRFTIDPYFTTFPGLDFSGTVTSPGEIDVYVDGNRVFHDHLDPGNFSLNNIYRYRGTGHLEIVVRDAYGREQHFLDRFYISDRLLSRGLQEFSYALGAQRENFGSESSDYGDVVFQGFHRYGMSNESTLGGAVEVSPDHFLAAPQWIHKVGKSGLADGSVAFSGGERGSGYMASAGFERQTRRTGLRGALQYRSEDYATLATLASDARAEVTASGSATYTRPEFGSFNVSVLYESDHRREATSSLGGYYSRNLNRNFSTSLSYRQEFGRSDDSLLFVSLSYQPKIDIIASARLTRSSTQTTSELELQNMRPLGEGFSYQGVVQNTSGDNGDSTLLDTNFEYRGRYGIYSTGYRGEDRNDGSYNRFRLGTSGAIAYVEGHWGATRPIQDSFALVKVGDLQGISVRHNSRTAGKTDRHGLLFIPETSSYYDNQISIDDREIPIDFSLGATEYTLSPPLRSGSCLIFEARRFQPITGHLHVLVNGSTLPLEHFEFVVTIEGTPVRLATGRGGEFYIDPIDLKKSLSPRPKSPTDCGRIKDVLAADPQIPESYRATLEYNGEVYDFDIPCPASAFFYIDAGTVVINREPSNEAPPENSSHD